MQLLFHDAWQAAHASESLWLKAVGTTAVVWGCCAILVLDAFWAVVLL